MQSHLRLLSTLRREPYATAGGLKTISYCSRGGGGTLVAWDLGELKTAFKNLGMINVSARGSAPTDSRRCVPWVKIEINSCHDWTQEGIKGNWTVRTPSHLFLQTCILR